MSRPGPTEVSVAVVRVRVPAKINLALCVGARRPDGYHELSTVFQAVSLYDEVTAAAADATTCEVRGAEAHKVGPGEDNLAYRAARLLQAEYGVRDGVHLLIDKRIPVAGGMAGGSADAAGALLACARLWGLDATPDDLRELGGRLGADVPFPLMGGCALGLGRGERLYPTLSRGTFHWVLAFARRGLSTPAVFRRYDELVGPGGPAAGAAVPTALIQALTTGNVDQVAALLTNDLTEAACALAPGLRTTLAVGRDAGARGAIISGSGPTVAFLAADAAAATDLAVALSSEGVAREVRLATGPVPGATVAPPIPALV
ncbi:MAG: 4-(cytidine 5'-diphospho)-2-C-methyl-D-erythritol kinase [Propionibacteriaceae bacterium]|jgi:4-diphosphocytidyl-2-C-methyl-D-erythritol kinase|nr:4-(cytidine 5'-diphospho)-2-C-methyl-D-erythritol kinase [Propionibacteriaceae bacterium]